MVLMIEPIAKCIETLKKERDYQTVIFMTPDGEKLTQKTSNQLSQFKIQIQEDRDTVRQH